MTIKNPKNALILGIVASVCLFTIFLERPVQGQQNRPQVQRQWEYAYDSVGSGFSDPNVPRIKMAMFGANGWELVTVYHDGAQAIAIYKRLKQ